MRITVYCCGCLPSVEGCLAELNSAWLGLASELFFKPSSAANEREQRKKFGREEDEEEEVRKF